MKAQQLACAVSQVCAGHVACLGAGMLLDVWIPCIVSCTPSRLTHPRRIEGCWLDCGRQALKQLSGRT